MARSEAARARRKARLAGYVTSVAQRNESATRALMRPDGLAPGSPSAFARPDRTIAVTEQSNNLPSNRRGTPTLPDTRDTLRDTLPNRARPEWARNEQTRRRRAERCDNSPGCVCAGCVNDRRVARLAAESVRRRNEGNWA